MRQHYGHAGFAAIERTTFWLDAAGSEVAPFTEISLADVERGTFRPRHAHAAAVADETLRQLEQAGRYRLMAWPVHCVIGPWGHNIHATLHKSLNAWEMGEWQGGGEKAQGGVSLRRASAMAKPSCC
ncbi:MAG: hypothetical protein LBG66_04035 [Gallionellaceae bacterium]|jgi:nicotinamidase-related amidase|nr:hypothetical protein [Gallionellaceae bacterium]